jgi:hypothetical protein
MILSYVVFQIICSVGTIALILIGLAFMSLWKKYHCEKIIKKRDVISRCKGKKYQYF